MKGLRKPQWATSPHSGYQQMYIKKVRGGLLSIVSGFKGFYQNLNIVLKVWLTRLQTRCKIAYIELKILIY